MPRRRKKSSPVNVPLGQLRKDVSGATAPVGALSVVQNLRPFGLVSRRGSVAHTPIEAENVVLPADRVTGTIVGLGRQVRDKRGIFSSQPSSSLDRFIIVTSSHVYVYDRPGDLVTEVYAFGSSSTDRRVQFAQIGLRTFLAVSDGPEASDPDALLMLQDDVCLEVAPPPPPVLSATAVSAANVDKLEVGVYLFRYAYELSDAVGDQIADPTIVALSRPYIHRQTVAGAVDFELVTVPQLGSWSQLIRRVGIYMTQKADETDTAQYLAAVPHLMNQPFYRVSSIETLEQGGSVRFADKSEKLPGYDALIDDNLFSHQLTPAAAFAYNRRLVVGDVSIDYAKPEANVVVYAGATAPPQIEAPFEPFVIPDGQTDYITITSVPDMRSASVVMAPPDYEYQFEGYNGAAWENAAAVDTAYSDVAGTYTQMRLRLTNTTNPDQAVQLTIDAANEYSSNQLVVSIEVAPT